MRRKALITVALCGAVVICLWAPTARAVLNPTDKCAADKIKAAGKYSMCLLKQEANAIRAGLDPEYERCDSTLARKWTRAEERGGLACPTLGDEIPVAEEVGADAAKIVAGLWGETSVGKGVIETEYDILSIENGESHDISVEAVDRWGDPVAFTAEDEVGVDCVAVSADMNAITVTGIGEFCSEMITLTSDTGITKTLEVKVYDPMVMDIGRNGRHLLIKYADEFRWRWSDKGSGWPVAREFYHAVAEPGWFPLGSTIFPDYIFYDIPSSPDHPPVELITGDGRKFLMILVKELLPPDPGADPEPALLPPEGYDNIWDYTASYTGTLWKAKCPAGYHALGVVAASTWGGHSPPSLEDTRCVKDEYTIPAGIVDDVYPGPGTGCERIGAPLIPSMAGERAPLDIGQHIFCPSLDCDSVSESARLLLVPLEVAEKRDSQLAKVSLDEYGDIVVGNIMYASSVRVPFTVMPNLNCSVNPYLCAWNVDNSPFYRIKREESYTKIQELDNRGSAQPAIQTITYTTGFSQTDTEAFSYEVGLEVTASGEAKLLGSGGAWSVTMSTKFGWDWSTARSYSTGTSLSWQMTCPAFTYGVAAQVKTRFHAFSEDDTGPIVSSPLEGGKNSVKWLQYPPVFH